MGIFAELTDDVLAVIKAAGKAVETFALSETQKLVAQAKSTDLGTLAFNLISLFQNHDMAGEAKLNAVVGALIPAIEEFVTKGGLPALVTSVEDFALEFVQSSYNDFVTNISKSASQA